MVERDVFGEAMRCERKLESSVAILVMKLFSIVRKGRIRYQKDYFTMAFGNPIGCCVRMM